MDSSSLFLAILFSLFVDSCSKGNQTVPTYFARKDKNGKLIDATDKSTWIKINAITLLSNADNSNQTLPTTVQVKPSIARDGQNVTVTWRGVPRPTANDIIALYCPENAKDNDYIDYIRVLDSPSYKEGYGERLVQLFNLRTNCQFRYFTNSTGDHQELTATSNTVMFEGGPEMPLQIHLALTGDPTKMRVMWVSGTGSIIRDNLFDL